MPALMCARLSWVDTDVCLGFDNELQYKNTKGCAIENCLTSEQLFRTRQLEAGLFSENL